MDKIIVLDFGNPENQLLARKIREMGIYSELLTADVCYEQLKKDKHIKGIILSGGFYDNLIFSDFNFDARILELEVPVLSIGLGNLLFNKTLDISSLNIKKGEVILEKSSLFKQVSLPQEVLLLDSSSNLDSHKDFKIIATSNNKVVAMKHQKQDIYALDFLLDLKNHEYGSRLLKNFIFGICKASGNWNMETFIQHEIKNIQMEVQDQKVLLALSGGVDSSVVAALLHKAIGNRLTCVFVDHGFMRLNEAEGVVATFKDHFGINLIHIDAKERFLKLLEGVEDPEEKRKRIGNEFIKVFDEEASKLSGIKYLAQGTLYTDIIESGTKTTQTIKSHHNVGGLPKDMKFKLIEPLKTLFKDEVRALGILLGLPQEIVYRQPFPGPGLAIRIIGEVTAKKLSIVRESDAILRTEVEKKSLDIWQYFTVLTNIKSVGIKNDERTYDYTIGIRAVSSIDGMTAEYFKLPYEVLDIISKRILSEVSGVNRIVYDITSKPPSTIEWE